MRWLRNLFMHQDDEADEEREQAKAAEVDELLLRSDEALKEKKRVVADLRGGRAIEDYRRVDSDRRG